MKIKIQIICIAPKSDDRQTHRNHSNTENVGGSIFRHIILD